MGLDQRIDVALANLGQQAALDNVCRTFYTVRNQAAAAVPDWEELRTKANAIKRDTIENLPKYLDQLEAAVRARGGHVYRAADGAAACHYIGEVIARRGATRVVKSKSMVTEEIELNHFLEHAGVEPVETDLGEYIVQLASEAPFHIIAPAIHKTRFDVAKLFKEKLHVDMDPEDIVGMCALARRTLREKFLNAGVGISGVNMAVAESGTVVVVENEGNARLCTSVPPVHIAVMGIEKVIPRIPDLAIFLKLLARSATGQKLSSYTSLITGPKRPGEPDGPEEFHLLLLDNGRWKVQQNPRTREALYCIRCGACLNVCPVYRKIGGHAYPWVYSGPIGAILSPQIRGLDDEPKLPFASSLCGACREACPVKIRIPELLLELRQQEVETAPQRHGLERMAFGVWSWAMQRTWAYEWGGLMARWLGGSLPFGPDAEWAKTRELPEAPPRSFREEWRRRGRS